MHAYQFYIIILQPEVHQFTSQLLPLLLEYLGHVTSGDALGRHGEANVSLTRTFYALEKFCESLGEHMLLVKYILVPLQTCKYITRHFSRKMV